MENSVSLLRKGTVGQYDISPVVVTFIHHKGRPRRISKLETYACNMETPMSHIVSSERTSRLLACMLVPERSALSDPYCQSTWNAASMCVCMYAANLRSNILETK